MKQDLKVQRIFEQLVKNYLPEHLIKELKKIKRAFLLHKGKIKIRQIIDSNQPILLEIGSGPRKGNNGWITLDLCKGSDIYWDLSLPLPFPDNSISKIYSSHLLEHFSHSELMKLLTQCYGVLKPDGVFSVCVPNAGIYIKAYSKSDNFSPKSIYKPALFSNSRIDYVNYIAYMGGEHKYMFDEDNLLFILKKVGFKDVHLRNFDPEIDMEGRDWESIYAECRK